MSKNNDLYYIVFHDTEYKQTSRPLPTKIITYDNGKSSPGAPGLSCYRYLLGKDISHSHRINQTIFNGLVEKDLTYLGLMIDVKEVYTMTYKCTDQLEGREFDLACGKFVDALKVYDGLSSKQRKSTIKNDPIYEVVYLTDVQKELYRAKGYMLKSIADAKFLKLIDESILDPKKLSDKKLINWFLEIFDKTYKLRF